MILLALICSITGSFFTSLGLIVMKLANIKIEKDQSKKFYFQVDWYAGLLLLGIAQTLNGFALKLGNITLIASTSCVTIIFNALMSPILLGEIFLWKIDGTSTALIALGCTTAVLQQPSESIQLDPSINISQNLKSKLLSY